jgi:hypothetical protein
LFSAERKAIMQRIASRLITFLAATIVIIPNIICVCAVGLNFYVFTPFPSPAPYPAATPRRIEFAAGAGYQYETFSYTVPISFEQVKRHYEVEMQRYCANTWQFSACSRAVSCLYAECLINRPFLTNVQSFTLQLQSSQITETEVIYTQIQLTP